MPDTYDRDAALHKLAVEWVTTGYATATIGSRLFYSRWASNHQLTTGPSPADRLIDLIDDTMPHREGRGAQRPHRQRVASVNERRTVGAGKLDWLLERLAQ